MDLQKLLSEKRQGLSAWFDFKGVDFLLAYTERAEMEKILERSKDRKWVRHQQIEAYDDELFALHLADKILDWKGLTLKKLAQWINIDISELDPDTPVDCSKENKILLLKEVYGLPGFIRQTIMDVAAYREKQELEEKKTSGNGPDK